MKNRDRYPLVCLIIFFAVFLAGAIKPLYFTNWVLENLIAVPFIIFLVVIYKKYRLSNVSYTLLLIFLILHTIGAHYTYSLVPFTDGLLSFIGLSRNFYDWLVHFSFGFLFFLPIREFLIKKYKYSLKRANYYPILFIMIAGLIFELFEWSIYLFVGNKELGAAFIAAQGEFSFLLLDTFIDVILNTLGSLLGYLLFASRKINL